MPAKNAGLISFFAFSVSSFCVTVVPVIGIGSLAKVPARVLSPARN